MAFCQKERLLFLGVVHDRNRKAISDKILNLTKNVLCYAIS